MARGVKGSGKTKTPRLEDFVLPSDDASRKRIATAVNEIVDLMTLIDSKKDCIKGIVEALDEELAVPKAFTNKLARAQHRRNLKEVEAQVDNLTACADVLVSYGLVG